MTNTQKTITIVAVIALLLAGGYAYKANAKKKDVAIPTPPKNVVASGDEKIIEPVVTNDPEPILPLPIDINPVVTPPAPIKPYCRPWTADEVALINSGVGRFSADFYENRCQFPTESQNLDGKNVNEFFGNTKSEAVLTES